MFLSSVLKVLGALIALNYNGFETSQGFTLKGNLHRQEQYQQLKPILFIPGKGGNQLEARLNKNRSRSNDVSQGGNYLCPTKKNWFRIWLNVLDFVPGEIDCFSENLELHFNNDTKRSETTPGVEFRVLGFGETKTVEYLDPSWLAWIMGNVGLYVFKLIAELRRWGYERGVSLRAAPYDFRFAPHSQGAYFERLKNLIEEMYSENGDRPVLLLAHSLGGLYSTYFLNLQSPEWKAKFVDSLFTYGTPWSGTARALSILTSGYDFGVSGLDVKSLVRQRSWETVSLLMPIEGLWDPDHVLISTPERNYTVNDYDSFYERVGFGEGKWQRRHMISGTDTLEKLGRHPGVDLYCFYGSGFDTVESLIFSDSGSEQGDTGSLVGKPHRSVVGDGDGTVNLRSLEACVDLFKDQAKEVRGARFRNFKLEKAHHKGGLERKEFLKVLNDVAQGRVH